MSKLLNETYFLPKKYERYTNYNGYVSDKRFSHEVEHKRIKEVIRLLCEIFPRPYIRFMWINEPNTARCVVYSDLKENTRFTKLMSFDSAEQYINMEYNKKRCETPANP